VYSKILVPFDFSEYSAEALRQGREIAGRFNAELHLVTVVEAWPPAASVSADVYPMYRDYVMHEQADATRRLNDLAATIAGSTPVQHATLAGNVEQQVVKYINDKGVDLVVLGTHGRTGISHWFIGSIAEKLARLAPCSVLIARPRRPAEPPAKK
jgi:nucleotide-binding universal stress UspA family protein